jgi:hypothetical protein
MYAWVGGVTIQDAKNVRKQGLTKVRANWSPRVTFHAPRSVGECEGINPTLPSAILGVGILMDS